LSVKPDSGVLKWRLDPHQNQQAYVLFSDPSPELTVEVDLVADLEPINPFDFLLDPGFETFPFHYSDALRNDLSPWLAVTAQQARLLALLGPLARTSSPTVDYVLAVNRRVTEFVQYQVRPEYGTQSPEQTLSLKSGSCRDMAWLLVQAFRAMGIASRFVSGYLIQLAPDQRSVDEPHLLTEDHVELHAWAEVFLPGAGWLGLDPTSGQMTAEGHIPLVCTPTPEEAAPIEGTVEPVKTEFSYSFRLDRLNKPRSIAQPLTDAEWERVRAVAHLIDAELETGDARLTMGGEPTYVGIDKPESPEWNLDAHGPAKRNRGMVLVQALRDRMGRGALLHYGMGKWYPGEPLPRWILSCHWRVDGLPIWEESALIAAEEVDYGYGPAEAERFIAALSRRLSVETNSILPAFNPEESESPRPPLPQASSCPSAAASPTATSPGQASSGLSALNASSSPLATHPLASVSPSSPSPGSLPTNSPTKWTLPPSPTRQRCNLLPTGPSSSTANLRPTRFLPSHASLKTLPFSSVPPSAPRSVKGAFTSSCPSSPCSPITSTSSQP
jgi:transglutaminase-like putative cysteine protease